MPTISDACRQYFAHDEFHKSFPNRGARRNIARFMYRQMSRPGLVNPSEPGEKVSRSLPQIARHTRRPMRHVYKFQEPQSPKRVISRAMIPRLGRQHRKVQ